MISFVIPALVTGIHIFLAEPSKAWMAAGSSPGATSPALTP